MPKITGPELQNKVDRVMAMMKKSNDEFFDAEEKESFYSTRAKFMSPDVI